MQEAVNQSVLTRDALAHLAPDGRPHLLIDHLTKVGARAFEFAEAFNAGEWGRVAGLWHDLGKYAGNFQKMIREANGFEAHIEGDVSGPRDHSTAGAIHACNSYGGLGRPIAFAIAGHHAGLANLRELDERLKQKRERYESALAMNPPNAVLNQNKLVAPSILMPSAGETREQGKARALSAELWTRMLFSALCDADFLDTEAFYESDRASRRTREDSIETLATRLERHLEVLEQNATDSEVNRVRAEVRSACIRSAQLEPGVFTLTVPTGGGKTLASMCFALEHARLHKKQRVIVGIPFTSIIEQTATVYRTALGDDAVLEHHCALDPNKETPLNRLSAENWDSPVVVTTTVQLLESLFANRPSRCRKLHRLTNSVIVLDEAQSLPPGLLTPILSVLNDLVCNFGVSLVICTATQPALGRTTSLPEGFTNVREIAPATIGAFERLRRVRVEWRTDKTTSIEELARSIANENDALAIVHRRIDARELCESLERIGVHDVLHLSALMCAEHRARVLDEVRRRKRAGEATRLVATQLVEAGVDLDFPVVYRAFGGFDSLAQAAGRCNREGRLSRLGTLKVFLAETQPPMGVPRTGKEIALGFLRKNAEVDIFQPSLFVNYFAQLYASSTRDKKQIQEMRTNFQFRDVASTFKLIEDDWSAPVVVPYRDGARRVADFEAYPSRMKLRALQRYTVTVPRKFRDDWVASGAAKEIAETVTVVDGLFAHAYDERYGLMVDRVGVVNSVDLIVDG